MSVDNPTLPGLEESAEPTLKAPSWPETLYFLTNSHNARRILGAGLLGGASRLLEGYRDDMLRFGGGRLILLAAPLGKSIPLVVNPDDLASYPVAIEIEPNAVDSESAELVQLGGERLDVAAYALNASFTMMDIKRILLPDSRLHEDFLKHQFEDIPIDASICEEAPALFAGGIEGTETTIEPLDELKPLDLGSVVSADDIERIGRLAAGIATVTLALPADAGALDDGLRLIGLKRASRKKDVSSIGILMRWIEQRQGKSTDDILLSIAMARLESDSDIARQHSSMFIDLVASDVADSEIDDENKERFSRQLSWARDVITGEASIRGDLFLRGNPILMSLLLAVTTPEPLEHLRPKGVRAEAPSEIRTIAAFMAGFVRGFVSLSRKMKSRALSSVVIQRASSLTGADRRGGPVGLAIRDLALESATRADGRAAYTLTWRGTLLNEYVEPAQPLAALLHEKELRVAAVRRAAIDLAKSLDWRECLVWIINTDALLDLTVDRKLGIAVRIPYSSSPELGLVDSNFLTRLSSAEAIDPSLEEPVRAALSGASQWRKRGSWQSLNED